MKEPYLLRFDGLRIPFSQAPVQALRDYDKMERMPPEDRDPEMLDEDFNARYAAILVRERGF